MTNETKTPKVVTIAQLAMKDAIAAVKGHDSAIYAATTSLALVMVSAQIDRPEDDETKLNTRLKGMFRGFLKAYAAKGNMVWRDTSDIVSLITAHSGDKRDKLVNAYIDGGKECDKRAAKPEKARLVDGLARLQTYSVRLMKDICMNEAALIRELRELRAAGADAEGLRSAFKSYVAGVYGETWNDLAKVLKTDKPTKKTEAIDAIIAKAEKMNLSDLQSLARQIQELYSKRAADESDTIDEFADEAESGEAERDAALDAQYGAGYAAKLRASNGGPILMENAA
jgi:hypothetical protein